MRLPQRIPKHPPIKLKTLGVICGIALVAALCFVVAFWLHWRRPGMRHYRRGMALLAAGNGPAAEQEWVDGAQEDPNDYHCYAILGDYYAGLRLYDNAAACYHAACDHRAGDGALRLRWAEAERRSGHLALAAAAAAQAYRLLPHDAQAAGLYGLIEIQRKKPALAAPALRRAWQLRPGDLTLFHELVNDEMAIPDSGAAEADLTPYLRRHPDDAQACLWMAMIRTREPHTPENLNAAIVLAQRAVRGGADPAAAYSTLGELYLDVNRPVEALAALLAGNKADPDSEPILRDLANCYARLGRTTDLTRVSLRFRKIVALHDRITTLQRLFNYDPHDIAHGLELARLVEEDGRYPLAQRYYERLAAAAPHDARVGRAISDFYRRLEHVGPDISHPGTAFAPVSAGTASLPLVIPAP